MRKQRNMMAARILGLLLLMGVMFVLETSGAETCIAPKTSGTVRVSLSSRRNQTGHWLAQVRCFNCRITSLSCNNIPVQLGRIGNKETTYLTSAPVSLDMEQSTAVCEGSEEVLITATVSAPPSPAGPGYRLIPGMGYYKFHDKSAVWEDARKICASEGAHLAIINSNEESTVLRDLYAEYPSLKDVMYNDFVFIGFHDLQEEGRYVTIFGEPLNSTGFMLWSGGQPDNAGGNPGEDCGSIHRNGRLNDLICTRKHAFICEQELF